MGDEDDVHWRGMAISVVGGGVSGVSGWWGAAGAQTYLGARTWLRPVTRGLMGWPCRQVGCDRSIY